jgi:hypothetical protein
VPYTSLTREGALAKLSFHWGQLTPLPTKPAALHRIRVAARSTLKLIETDLLALGVDMEAYRQINYPRTQEIGAAVAFLGCDGLLAPSSRWNSDNLMLFTENHAVSERLEAIESEEVNWLDWAIAHQLLDPAITKARPR